MSLASDTKLRVFICDEHPILVAGVRSFLGRSPDIEVVGEASSAGAFLPLISEACPDIIIVDAVPGGISLIRCLVQAFPNARIICLSEQDDHRHIGEALAAGARAYVLKTSPGESLLRAVEALRRGGQYVEGQGCVPADSWPAARMVTGRCSASVKSRSSGWWPSATAAGRSQRGWA